MSKALKRRHDILHVPLVDADESDAPQGIFQHSPIRVFRYKPMVGFQSGLPVFTEFLQVTTCETEEGPCLWIDIGCKTVRKSLQFCCIPFLEKG